MNVLTGIRDFFGSNVEALEKVSVWQTISAQPEKHIIVFQALVELVPFVFDTFYCVLLVFLIKGLGYAAGEGPFPCVVLTATEY